jgi:DNA-binding NtrC family response regulator
MQPLPIPSASRVRPRTAVIASADGSVRQRLNEILTGLRWQVREASGGAEAWTKTEEAVPEAVIVDSWLPDLDCGEFLRDFRTSFPEVALFGTDGLLSEKSPHSPHRQELLYALRSMQDSDTAAWNSAPVFGQSDSRVSMPRAKEDRSRDPESAGQARKDLTVSTGQTRTAPSSSVLPQAASTLSALGESSRAAVERLPEIVGNARCMLEVSRRIRLVAPRSTPVLIEGPTGSGKELVAEALHRLSARSRKSFVAINCAAIPEALLEAELFGHTRGAFTGAVQGRVGRIEAANGGTLFLDEIGEMPLSLQAKLLRFVESGELQRIGDNETLKVDVRIIAATHRPLAQHTQTGLFRADLYYRLAVFLIRTPALSDHLEDLPALIAHFLERMGRSMPIKRIDPGAFAKLAAHSWPGNVRELDHVLERAAILAADEPLLTSDEIDFGILLN